MTDRQLATALEVKISFALGSPEKGSALIVVIDTSGPDAGCVIRKENFCTFMSRTMSCRVK